MSYQVLARKWRPRVFREMVGQTHVLQALINALDHDRLHHAYLFTGTRGVGKTTIARILAKCLNCESGVSSEPCGQCGSCREIEEGRFVDLIEVDAASRTKVEDTRELLDNVQYAPTRGRYKVYLIDEVHMLSAHSFNALLKTLEEPPPHVKFLLATTDPQKLPITILSRCLQFNLKNMSPERVVGHLRHVLEQEVIPFEEPALWQLGRAADGSMRDALSLTDQAIAYGAGRVTEQEVSAMLGTIDQSQVYQIIEALVDGSVANTLSSVNRLAEFSPDFSRLLADMLSVMHRMALAQALPDAVDNSQGDRERVMELASRVTAEDLHLFYQVALIGRKDLPLAPDPKAGFEMVLLRMLAFKPDGTPEPATEPLLDAGEGQGAGSGSAGGDIGTLEPQPAAGADGEAARGAVAAPPPEAGAGGAMPSGAGEAPAPVKKPLATAEVSLTPAAHPVPSAPIADSVDESDADQLEDAYATEQAYQQYMAATEQNASPGESASAVAGGGEAMAPPWDDLPDTEPATEPTPEAAVVLPVEASVQPQTVVKVPAERFTAADWAEGFKAFGLSGVTLSIATHLEFVGIDGKRVTMRIAPGHATLLNSTHEGRIQQALQDYFALELELTIDQSPTQAETPAQYIQRHAEERLARAQNLIAQDPNVKAILEQFSATILDDSIQPV
ncbi:DNA polymerase III subunit gamma/tau [Aestuariirhabdus litorea]|uniref:DNA polymerase III subunit gamma/tau n=1 Tax=Aestuariirhabdus litorea TaxID=2528527 RepID=A0A3P3VS74_9GAMM|nr:DNA polymerase III subunit gamma/tau [Aestuariirhabdus litorea]RRJ84546.1 DNA polymerase III subunit gamma/tau [Aestuariirhabdus litorea]RWW97772.1 DNA polymerase III subunit gamma/tau [Endozoicomonadaceae bacterium GTF-13]